MSTFDMTLWVNGRERRLEVPANATLLDVLRDDLGFTGAKSGCGMGECGACTVLLDDLPVPSCLTPALAADGGQVMTIEGLAGDDGLHPLQQAFIEYGAVECGFCTPGMILTARALLAETPDPSEEEIRHYLRGNLCRCTGYAKVVEAIVATVHGLKAGGDA